MIYMSLIKHKPQNFKFNQANNNTSLWIVETTMQVEHHFLDEVGDVAVFGASDVHCPVMCESLRTANLFNRGSMSEFYLHLYRTVLKVLDKILLTTGLCTISRFGYFLFLKGKKNGFSDKSFLIFFRQHNALYNSTTCKSLFTYSYDKQ